MEIKSALMNLTKKQSIIAIGYFLFITILGVILRSFSVTVIDFNYRHIVHTHSHIGLLGWVYTGLMVLIYHLYLRDSGISKIYNRVFVFTHLTIIGMLVTFPFMGYALFSILFSTLFILSSYYTCYLVFKYTPDSLKKTNSYRCIRFALWYMIISSAGPWSLGIIMNTLGDTSSWYRNAIYFYLHFQYNGWFLLAILGIFIYILEKNTILIPPKIFKRFFFYFNLGIIFTFSISIFWMKLHPIINWIGGVGSLLQTIAFIILLQDIFTQKIKIKLNPIMSIIFNSVLMLFLLKLIIQGMSCLSPFSKIISANSDFIIGYLHLIFLGIVSLSLLGFLYFYNFIKVTKSSIIIYLIAFFLTESLLFYRGITVWKDYHLMDGFNYLLLLASSCFLISIGLIFIFQWKKKYTTLN